MIEFIIYQRYIMHAGKTGRRNDSNEGESLYEKRNLGNSVGKNESELRRRCL